MPFGVRGLNLRRSSLGVSGAPADVESDRARNEPLVEMPFRIVTVGESATALSVRMRRRKLRRHLQGDVDPGERLADWTSQLRRFCRRFESGGVEPVDVAYDGESRFPSA